VVVKRKSIKKIYTKGNERRKGKQNKDRNAKILRKKRSKDK
jgi:hypothetical protein